MNKGFTLFTALVAVLIVFLGIILTQTMIRGERSSVEIVISVEEEAEMLDFASLRRTDAIQEFNYGLRSAFEKYFTKDDDNDDIPDNFFTISSDTFTSPNRDAQWEQLKREFVAQNFGDFSNCEMLHPLEADDAADDAKLCLATLSNPNCCKGWPFVNFVSDKIRAALTQQKIEGTYISTIDEPDITNYTKVFKKILLDIFARSAINNDFLTVSACNGEYLSGCDGGGFYINLDFGEEQSNGTGISNKVYEALPQINVTKEDTCKRDNTNTITTCSKVLRQPIFPRSTLRVFVPTRMFKALAGAHEIILSQSAGDNLLFNKTDIEKLKLGVCDSDRVRVLLSFRPNPIPLAPPIPECDFVDRHMCKPRENFFVAQTTPGFGQACIGYTGPPDPPSNKILTSVPIAQGGTYNPNEESDIRSAIKLFVEETYMKQLVNVFSSNIQNIITAFPDDFELIPNGDNILWNRSVDTQGFESRTVIPSGKSFCSKVKTITGMLIFEEKNPLYKIDKANPGKFAIRIVENYNPSFGIANGETHSTCETTASFTCPNPTFGLGPCPI